MTLTTTGPASSSRIEAAWTVYQLSRTTDEVLQAAIKEVSQMLEAGEITKARADELIDFIR